MTVSGTPSTGPAAFEPVPDPAGATTTDATPAAETVAPPDTRASGGSARPVLTGLGAFTPKDRSLKELFPSLAANGQISEADAEALIIDVRRCPGGGIGMPAALASYLFEKPQLLLYMESRDGTRDPVHTEPLPEGARVVSVGAGFLRDGEAVRVIED